MNLFRLKEWWRYRRAALGRHGVHSPFVYRFIDKGLLPRIPKGVLVRLAAVTHSANQFAQAKTLYRTLKFMNTARLEWAGDEQLGALIGALTESADLIYCAEYSHNAVPVDCLLIATGDEEIRPIFSQRAHQLARGCFFILTDIHSTEKRKMDWVTLCADARVNLSIDLWHVGLLFYRPDFKVKQHFVLKHQT
jgi:hypothetical protein